MHSQSKLTVLMPVYNTRLDWLQAASESIINQTYRNFDFLIIDDGSEQKCAQFVDDLAKKDNRIRVIHNDSNKGLVDTLNIGLNSTDSTWIARMDSDDWSYPTRFERQLAYLEKHPDTAVLGTAAIYLETGRRASKAIIPATHGEILGSLPFLCCFFHPSVILNRKKVLSVGGYPNRPCAEDYSLWMKMAFTTDFRLANLKDILLKYRRGESRPQYREKQVQSTALAFQELSELLGIDMPLIWQYPGRNDFSAYSESILTHLEALDKLKIALISKFTDIDKNYLNLSILREKKKLLSHIKKNSVEVLMASVNNELAYLISSIVIRRNALVK